MTATLRHYSHGVIENADGTAAHFGSNTQPTKEVTVDGDVVEADTIIPIPAGQLVPLWIWTANDPDFAVYRLEIVGGDGYLDVYWQVDKPTSTTDSTPLGTCLRWNEMDFSCFTEHIQNSQAARVNPTLATAAGDAAGLPAMAASGATVDGRVYKVMVKNRGATAVSVKRTRVN
jgi:hypothetical protein